MRFERGGGNAAQAGVNILHRRRKKRAKKQHPFWPFWGFKKPRTVRVCVARETFSFPRFTLPLLARLESPPPPSPPVAFFSGTNCAPSWDRGPRQSVALPLLSCTFLPVSGQFGSAQEEEERGRGDYCPTSSEKGEQDGEREEEFVHTKRRRKGPS